MTASGVSIFKNGSGDAGTTTWLFSLMLGLYARMGLPETCRVFSPV